MERVWAAIAGLVTGERLLVGVKVVLILVVGFALAWMISKGIDRVLAQRGTAQQRLLARRGTFYVTTVVTVVGALNEMGVHLGALMGAAGILTVAIGFASQTAASNIISGVFLLAERSFQVGDVLRIGEVTGIVTSIDLLSIRLQTFDNLMVRVSNEMLIKTLFTNLSHHPIRRLDLQLSVDYDTDLSHVRKILCNVSDIEPMCLDEPEAQVIFKGFGESAMNLQFSTWTTRENYIQVRSIVPERVKQAFDAEGIKIPFPQRVIHAAGAAAASPRAAAPRRRDPRAAGFASGRKGR